MNMLAVAVEHYLQSQEWHYKFDEEKNFFSLTMGLKKIDSAKVFIRIGEDYITTYAMLPTHVREEKRNVVCRYIARANYGLRNGNLEIDLDDGEVRYKTYLYAKNRIPNQEEIERYVDICFLTLDRYAEGLMKILYADLDDKAAIQLVEG
ncbi:MAG: YbjN domain-containing protein [Candidatus Spyradocola sp.]|jgi:hypothetical protein